MNPEEELQTIKREIDSKSSLYEQAKGRLEFILERLQSEFSCKSLKEAGNRLIKLKSKKEKLSKEFDTKLNKLKEEFDL